MESLAASTAVGDQPSSGDQVSLIKSLSGVNTQQLSALAAEAYKDPKLRQTIAYLAQLMATSETPVEVPAQQAAVASRAAELASEQPEDPVVKEAAEADMNEPNDAAQALLMLHHESSAATTSHPPLAAGKGASGSPGKLTRARRAAAAARPANGRKASSKQTSSGSPREASHGHAAASKRKASEAQADAPQSDDGAGAAAEARPAKRPQPAGLDARTPPPGAAAASGKSGRDKAVPGGKITGKSAPYGSKAAAKAGVQQQQAPSGTTPPVPPITATTIPMQAPTEEALRQVVNAWGNPYWANSHRTPTQQHHPQQAPQAATQQPPQPPQQHMLPSRPVGDELEHMLRENLAALEQNQVGCMHVPKQRRESSELLLELHAAARPSASGCGQLPGFVPSDNGGMMSGALNAARGFQNRMCGALPHSAVPSFTMMPPKFGTPQPQNKADNALGGYDNAHAQQQQQQQQQQQMTPQMAQQALLMNGLHGFAAMGNSGGGYGGHMHPAAAMLLQALQQQAAQAQAQAQGQLKKPADLPAQIWSSLLKSEGFCSTVRMVRRTMGRQGIIEMEGVIVHPDSAEGKNHGIKDGELGCLVELPDGNKQVTVHKFDEYLTGVINIKINN